MLRTASALTVLLAGAPQSTVAGKPVQHLELRLSDWRGFAPGAFFLEMVPSGEVTRHGDAPLGPKRVEADIRRSLRLVITRERFFQLKRSYGDAVIEGRFREITVTLDGRRHSVVVNDLTEADKPVEEIARALRVWYAALEALSDAGTVWTERQDRPFLGSGK